MFREIDVAFLRRFERKILVDLPKPKDRIHIIQHFLPESQNWTSDKKNELSEITVGLTGADIKIACKAASLKKIQKAIDGRKGNLIMKNINKGHSNFVSTKTICFRRQGNANRRCERKRSKIVTCTDKTNHVQSAIETPRVE